MGQKSGRDFGHLAESRGLPLFLQKWHWVPEGSLTKHPQVHFINTVMDYKRNRKGFRIMKTGSILTTNRKHQHTPVPSLWSFFSAILLLLSTGSIAHAQSPTVVESIAALRSLNAASFTNDTVALVIDYYGSGTISAGLVAGISAGVHPYSVINASPKDDGGRFIACSSYTNGLWERMLEGETPNVKMWGAYGDGINNDYVAITNAIWACGGWVVGTGSAPGVAEMLFPGGVYRITNTIVFNSSVIHIRGEGSGPAQTIVLMQTNCPYDIFQTYNAQQALLGFTPSYDQSLLFENMGLWFEGTEATRNTNNSALVICNPGEAHSIRNIQTEGGAIGIRCFGTGAPGLKLRDVTVDSPTIAGLSIEPYPGQPSGGGDPISVIGISGDCRYSNAMPQASLILFSNVNSGGSISQIKAEGQWGGGVVQYAYPPISDVGDSQMAALSIDNTLYNSAAGTYSSNFVVLKGQLSPAVTINGAHLYGVKNLINDQVMAGTSRLILTCIVALHNKLRNYPSIISALVTMTVVFGKTIHSLLGKPLFHIYM